MKKNIINGLGILGILLLFPVVLAVIDLVNGLITIAGILIKMEPGFVGELVQVSTSTVISQAIYQVYLVPGLVICSVVTYKFKLRAVWYWGALKVIASVMFFCPPLLTVAGFYTLLLSRANRS